MISSSSQANSDPVLPIPHITSSKINKTLYLSHISLIRLKYPETGVNAPAVAPTTVSAIKAITFSEPRLIISSSNSFATLKPYSNSVSS